MGRVVELVYVVTRVPVTLPGGGVEFFCFFFVFPILPPKGMGRVGELVYVVTRVPVTLWRTKQEENKNLKK
jgi:hypothetical protein